MKKFFSLAIVVGFLSSLLATAFAGNLINPYRYAVTSPPATIAFASNTGSGTDGSSFSFATQATGTAAADRINCVGVGFRSGGPATAVTVNGQSATAQIQANNSGSNYFEIWCAANPTGTTGTVAVTTTGTAVRLGVGVWALYGVTLPATDTASANGDPASTTALDINVGGVAIGYGYSAAANTSTWTGLTEDFDANDIEGQGHSGASLASAGGASGATYSQDFSAATQSGTVFAAFR